VGKNQQFEIENTVVDLVSFMKKNSVIKLYNRFQNPTSDHIDNLTVSLEASKGEGGETGTEADQEPDMSMFDNQDASGIVSKRDASDLSRLDNQ